ncbi:hypothetical protein PHAVU_010G047800 [Phaseolus vulgaris]
MITILTVDSGGIKGIIPAKVLDHLDKALKAKNPNADIAHYFDVIGGTSTGGLMTAMLATPSPQNPNRAAFSPAQIVDFYKQNGPNIFKASGIIYSFGLYIDESCNQWQEYNLNPDFSDPSNVTQENMDGLEDTGKQLLQEKVVKRNLDTFDLEQAVETNAEALDR